MLSPVSSSCSSSPSSSRTVPRRTTKSSSESPCAYCSAPVEPPGSSSPTNTSSSCSGFGVSSILRPRIPKASVGRSARRSTRARVGSSGWKRSEMATPSPSAIRRREAMLALARPRSTWLRKLSLSPARSATSRSVRRRRLRIARRRSPTSTSFCTSAAPDGILPDPPFDPVEEELKRPYGTTEGRVNAPERTILAADATADRPSRGGGSRPPRRAPDVDARRACPGAGARAPAARGGFPAGRCGHEPPPARPRDRGRARPRRAADRRASGSGCGAGRRAGRGDRSWRDRARGGAPAGLWSRGGRARRRAGAGVPALRPRARRAEHCVTAVRVRGLRKSYGALEAVRGFDCEIEEGEVFGLLGPNGAGKTATVEILEGYRRRDAGEVAVLGDDPQAPGPSFRERIGVVLQQSELWPLLTVRETHRLFAGYYKHPRDVDEVIELVGLADKADARVKTLSGGQKRRLDLGVALVGDPELVFMDEPTTGFDPAARRAAWEMIRSLRSLGKTVLLTTHYLDEAEHLSDRVAVLREGRIVATGTPAELTRTPATEIRYRENGREVVVRTAEPTRVLAELTAQAVGRGEELQELEVRRPSLEEVYLELTE